MEIIEKYLGVLLKMKNVYVIAEAAQGYEGSVEISKLLIRSAKMAGADAIKFQVVYVDELAEKGYQHYDLFKSLEMPTQSWMEIREYVRENELDFVVDIFGNRSYQLAKEIKPDGIKIHSTSFFDETLITKTLSLPTHIYFSVGGIFLDELKGLVQTHDFLQKKNISILYGFQAEPTPIESNNLLRIPALRDTTGIKSIGFMDHSDGETNFNISLSAVALGLGVQIFEKHITLDRHLQMEDYISALGVSDFAVYVSTLKGLYKALGSANLKLNTEEIAYRERSIKRVVAAKDLAMGQLITKDDIRLNRPCTAEGFFKVSDVIGKFLNTPVKEGEPITQRKISI
jgi:sialic acid synthase SpsE